MTECANVTSQRRSVVPVVEQARAAPINRALGSIGGGNARQPRDLGMKAEAAIRDVSVIGVLSGRQDDRAALHDEGLDAGTVELSGIDAMLRHGWQSGEQGCAKNETAHGKILS
jgi:hypothetical protein